MRISRVGDLSLVWGESLRWDDRRRRLYFVDCRTQTLHWLDGGVPPLQSLKLPSGPTGVVLAEDGRLVVALDDGLHLVDVDVGTTELLTPYPAALGSRANDANADLDGNLVTGTLNLAPGPGSYWWFSAHDGWRQLDTGTVGPRRLFADTSKLGGVPDGACPDDDGGVWSCILGPGAIARYSQHGLEDVIDTGVELPSDVTFGGEELDRMFFVSIAVGIAGVEVSSPNAGAVMVVDDSGYRGRPEPRLRL